jgi:hypothetical protein
LGWVGGKVLSQAEMALNFLLMEAFSGCLSLRLDPVWGLIPPGPLYVNTARALFTEQRPDLNNQQKNSWHRPIFPRWLNRRISNQNCAKNVPSCPHSSYGHRFLWTFMETPASAIFVPEHAPALTVTRARSDRTIRRWTYPTFAVHIQNAPSA